MTAIDLNADLGEGENTDSDLLAIVSSCNIACGGHYGDKNSMTTTVRTAIEKNVAIGAHPSYPDRQGFGRRRHFLKGTALRESLESQMRGLQSIVRSLEAPITHVKPHGALYNDVADDSDLAKIVVQASIAVFGRVAIVGLPNSSIQQAVVDAKLQFVVEGFVDRAYLETGRLVPREDSSALLVDHSLMAQQAIDRLGEVDSLCIHGDTPNAVDAARAVRSALQHHGVSIRAITG